MRKLHREIYLCSDGFVADMAKRVQGVNSAIVCLLSAFPDKVLFRSGDKRFSQAELVEGVDEK